MKVPHETKKLDYIQAGAQQPVETRIVIEQYENGTCYIDPPGSLSGIVESLIFASVTGGIAAFIVIVIVLRCRTFSNMLGLSCVAAIFASGTFSCIANAKKLAEFPTILKVERCGLSLTHPLLGCHHWSRDEIRDIYSDSMLPWNIHWRNYLVIAVKDKKIPLLNSRPFPEVEWLARQLRDALGIDSARTTK